MSENASALKVAVVLTYPYADWCVIYGGFDFAIVQRDSCRDVSGKITLWSHVVCKNNVTAELLLRTLPRVERVQNTQHNRPVLYLEKDASAIIEQLKEHFTIEAKDWKIKDVEWDEVEENYV